MYNQDTKWHRCIESARRITYGNEFWCRFTWSVRWSEREKAREQRLKIYKDDEETGCLGLIFCDAMKMETQGMMTVLQTLLWWGLLCYLLRTSSAPSCFHSMVKKDKRGLNFSDPTLAKSLATKSEHYVWCSDSVQTKGMSSSQHLQDNHCRL